MNNFTTIIQKKRREKLMNDSTTIVWIKGVKNNEQFYGNHWREGRKE